jgi:hypothetical protein
VSLGLRTYPQWALRGVADAGGERAAEPWKRNLEEACACVPTDGISVDPFDSSLRSVHSVVGCCSQR